MTFIYTEGESVLGIMGGSMDILAGHSIFSGEGVTKGDFFCFGGEAGSVLLSY